MTLSIKRVNIKSLIIKLKYMPKMSKEALYIFIQKAGLVWMGLCSLLLGIACSIIPFIPGFIFVFLGVILITKGSETIRNLSLMQIIRKQIKKRLLLNNNLIFKKLLILM